MKKEEIKRVTYISRAQLSETAIKQEALLTMFSSKLITCGLSFYTFRQKAPREQNKYKKKGLLWFQSRAFELQLCVSLKTPRPCSIKTFSENY